MQDIATGWSKRRCSPIWYESVSEDNAPLDFDDFVNRVDLEETVNRYIRGALHPIMERTLSFRLED